MSWKNKQKATISVGNAVENNYNNNINNNEIKWCVITT